MKEFEIWSEGYAATGEHATADFIGKSMGNNFDEACENFRYPKDITVEYTGDVIIKKGAPLSLDRNTDGSYRRGSFRSHNSPNPELLNPDGNYSCWACQYFDNEIDARKSFG